jgi:hypothetical protein
MRTFACILTLSLVSVVQAGSTVPFHATIDTQVAVVGGGPTSLDLHISGTGHGSHLGLLETDGLSHVDIAAGTQTGTFALIGADGSSFVISYAGTVVFTSPDPTAPVTFQGHWQAVSGSGRFEGVSGGGTGHGSAAGDTGILFLDGTLSNSRNNP